MEQARFLFVFSRGYDPSLVPFYSETCSACFSQARVFNLDPPDLSNILQCGLS